MQLSSQKKYEHLLFVSFSAVLAYNFIQLLGTRPLFGIRFEKKSAAAPGVNGAVSVTSVTLEFKTKLSEPQGVKVFQT